MAEPRSFEGTPGSSSSLTSSTASTRRQISSSPNPVPRVAATSRPSRPRHRGEVELPLSSSSSLQSDSPKSLDNDVGGRSTRRSNEAINKAKYISDVAKIQRRMQKGG